ncbi:MAG: hypothetical protein ABI678_23020 [Kofleriaceae bacterium]
MRLGLLVFMILARAAAAQPAMTPALPSPQQAIPTPEEREILAAGEIGTGAHLGGVVASVALGFGTGQAIQGRWSDTGWIFTFGEIASMAVMIKGMRDGGLGDCFEEPCHRNRAGAELAIGGLLAFAVFHTWEVADAIVVPSLHNDRYHHLLGRYGYPQLALKPYVAPHGDGAVAGLSLQF